MDFISETLNERHDRSALGCGHADLDGWLRDHALHAAVMHTGRTFVWHAGDGVVRAYFTLAAHLLRKEIPRQVSRGSPQVIPAILLARLALAQDLHGQGRGAELLRDALSRAVAANQQAAARLVVVDAINDEAVSFYRHYGFVPIPNNPYRVVQKMSSIEAALE